MWKFELPFFIRSEVLTTVQVYPEDKGTKYPPSRPQDVITQKPTIQIDLFSNTTVDPNTKICRHNEFKWA